MKNLTGKTALITGASSGIGEAFVYLLAKHGMHLVITARSEDKLHLIAEKVTQACQVNVLVLPEDLAKKGAAENLFNSIQARHLHIDLLINNAGFGKWSNFLDEPLHTYEEMIELNVSAIIKLTHLLLPPMLQKGEGGIINVASTGAFQPCPYITAYCASKAFVLSFSEGLYGEYFSKGITITALCPGNTATAFQAIAGAEVKGMRSDTADKVIRKALQALMLGKNYTVVGLDNYIMSLLPRLVPRRWIISFVSKFMQKRIKVI